MKSGKPEWQPRSVSAVGCASRAPVATLDKLDGELLLSGRNNLWLNQIEAVHNWRKEQLTVLKLDPDSRATCLRDLNDFQSIQIVIDAQPIFCGNRSRVREPAKKGGVLFSAALSSEACFVQVASDFGHQRAIKIPQSARNPEHIDIVLFIVPVYTRPVNGYTLHVQPCVSVLSEPRW